MGFRYLTNVPLEQALREYLDVLVSNGMMPRDEVVPVPGSAGRVTAGPVYARICAPYYNASAMDGIALDARLTFGASETTPVTLVEGQYWKVNTGDPIPGGCDAVVMIEDVIDGGVNSECRMQNAEFGDVVPMRTKGGRLRRVS